MLLVTIGLSLVTGIYCIQQRRMLTAPVLASYIQHATAASIPVVQKAVLHNAPILHITNNSPTNKLSFTAIRVYRHICGDLQ